MGKLSALIPWWDALARHLAAHSTLEQHASLRSGIRG